MALANPTGLAKSAPASTTSNHTFRRNCGAEVSQVLKDAFRERNYPAPESLDNTPFLQLLADAISGRLPPDIIPEKVRPALENRGLLIDVPALSLGGHTIGPVWFTRRADTNFHDYISQWMDRRVDGALGGSALRYFTITLDYLNAVAILRPIP